MYYELWRDCGDNNWYWVSPQQLLIYNRTIFIYDENLHIVGYYCVISCFVCRGGLQRSSTSPIILFRLPVIFRSFITGTWLPVPWHWLGLFFYSLYCNRNPFVGVLQFNLFLPTCTRNMPRVWIYLGILLFLFAVNLSTQGKWRISVIATPHIYTW